MSLDSNACIQHCCGEYLLSFALRHECKADRSVMTVMKIRMLIRVLTIQADSLHTKRYACMVPHTLKLLLTPTSSQEPVLCTIWSPGPECHWLSQVHQTKAHISPSRLMVRPSRFRACRSRPSSVRAPLSTRLSSVLVDKQSSEPLPSRQ